MNYNQLIVDQLREGIIEQCDISDNFSHLHYMPHHCVVKTERETTKVRVVFDGAAKAFKRDRSINECLMKGPQLLPKIFPLLIRFRTFQFGFTADISKAFLMISIDECDRNFLRFLWYKNHKESNSEIVCYRFCRLPFGLICSPAILNSVISQPS